MDNRANLPDEIILNCRKCLNLDYQIGHPEYYYGKTYEELQKELFAHQWNFHSDSFTESRTSDKNESVKTELDQTIETAAFDLAEEIRAARQMLGSNCKNGECD